MASGSRSRRLGALADRAELLRVGLGRHVGGQPAVGQPAGDAQHARPVRREPDRRSAALVGVEADHGVLEPEELALEADRPVRLPEQPQDLDRLLEAADRLLPLEAVGSHVHALAGAEPEDRAPARQVVDRQRLLGEHRRMPVDRVRHADADPDPLGRRARGAHHDQRVEEEMRVRLEVRELGEVLVPDGVGHPAHQVPGPPDRVEAVGLRLLGELDGLRGRRHDAARGAEGDSHPAVSYPTTI